MLLKKPLLPVDDQEKEQIKQSLLGRSHKKKQLMLETQQKKIEQELSVLYATAQAENEVQRLGISLFAKLRSMDSEVLIFLYFLPIGTFSIFDYDVFLSLFVIVIGFLLVLFGVYKDQIKITPEILLNKIEMKERQLKELKESMKKDDETL